MFSETLRFVHFIFWCKIRWFISNVQTNYKIVINNSVLLTNTLPFVTILR